MTKREYTKFMGDKHVLPLALAQTQSSDLCLLLWALDSVFFVISLEMAAGTSLILVRSSILGLVFGRRTTLHYRDIRNVGLGD